MATGLIRAAAVFAACAMVAGACADKDDDQRGAGAATTTTALAPAGAPGAPDAASDTTSATSTTRASMPPSPTNATAPAAPDATNAIRAQADSQPGAFAGTLLAPGLAQRIELDVMVQPGASADPATIDRVAALLRQHSGKAVSVNGPRTIGVPGNSHTPNQIRSIADTLGSPQGRGNTGVIYLLYLDGAFENDGVLGVTVRGDVAAIFPDSLARAATPFVSRARIERSVVIHEVGHLLGLVDIYLGTRRGDPAHPGHSANRASVMYWAVESSAVAQLLGGPPPVDFDAADVADLARIRSGVAAGG